MSPPVSSALTKPKEKILSENHQTRLTFLVDNDHRRDPIPTIAMQGLRSVALLLFTRALGITNIPTFIFLKHFSLIW